ncbi:MAG: sulfurtransferase [Steroidobacteraceae bacterium]|nr:sulfurtransferase [Steroidobacteraceae bacterium]
MISSTLVTPADLMGHLADPEFRVVDCRFDLARPDAGETAYGQGHVPGALYAHLDRDLAGPVTQASGRHPLPDPAALAARLERWGIGNATQVIAYDEGGGMFAARLWWLMRWLGHDRVAVLDGGLKAWLASGGTLETSVAQPAPARFETRLRPELAVDAGFVARALAANSHVLVDARGPERFRGEVEPIDPVAGHVPGAVNHPFQQNLGPDGRFLPPAELARRWRAALGSHGASETLCMCGSGVTACHNLLALEVAGLGQARLYPGSWSEWIRDPARPVAPQR